MSSAMLAVSAVLVAFEFQNVVSWWRGRTIAPGDEMSSDFTIVVPLFGHPRYFARRASLVEYCGNVLVALEVGSPLMASFADELEQEGWRVERLRLDNPNPAALVKAALPAARTDALRLIMERHSLSTPGEDIETGRVALALRMRVRHLDIVVETDAPDTWRALVRQRRLWWAGAFRHWWINFDRNLLHLPVITTYSLAVVWASIYFRWWTLIDVRALPRTLPLMFAAYVFVTVVSNLQVPSPWMLAFPFYSLLQILVMPALGAVQYVMLSRRRGALGRYGFGYRRRSEVLSLPAAVLERRLGPARTAA
ncbi:MAG TPA: hypothetical protein VGJ77_16405 [Gaiellaceae bacterium]